MKERKFEVVNDHHIITDCFDVCANDDTGVITVNGLTMTKDLIDAIKNNKNGCTVKMEDGIFYRATLLSAVFRVLLSSFFCWLTSVIIVGLLILLTSCSVLDWISSDDPNRYYCEDTTLVQQIDSVYGDEYDWYEDEDGGYDYTDFYHLPIKKTYEDSLKNSLITWYDELDWQDELNDMGIKNSKLVNNNKLLKARLDFYLDSLRNIIATDSINDHNKEMELIDRLTKIKKLTEDSDSIDQLLSESNSKNTTYIIIMILLLITIFTAMIVLPKKEKS